LIQGDFAGAWDKFKEMIHNAVEFAKETLANLATAILELLPLMGEAAKNIGKAIFDGIWEGLGDLWQLGADIIDWVLQGLRAMAGSLIGEARRIGAEVLSALNPVNIVGNAIGGLGGGGSTPNVGFQENQLMGGGGGGGNTSVTVGPSAFIPLGAQHVTTQTVVNNYFSGFVGDVGELSEVLGKHAARAM
jgi:hypothetical protein